MEFIYLCPFEKVMSSQLTVFRHLLCSFLIIVVDETYNYNKSV